MNHQAPQKQNTESKKKWVEDYVWKRASQHFGEGNFKIFDGVDPTDVIMGSVNDCYAFAALSGLASARIEELDFDAEKQGERVRDNFLVQEVNSAGCYAI